MDSYSVQMVIFILLDSFKLGQSLYECDQCPLNEPLTLPFGDTDGDFSQNYCHLCYGAFIVNFFVTKLTKGPLFDRPQTKSTPNNLSQILTFSTSTFLDKARLSISNRTNILGFHRNLTGNLLPKKWQTQLCFFVAAVRASANNGKIYFFLDI